MHPTSFHEFIANFLIIVVSSVAVLLVSHRLRLSAVMGFLVTGMLIGPSGLDLIHQEDVGLFAEIGIVILLFTVGLEFSLTHLRLNWRPFLVGGGLQVAGTAVVISLLAMLLGRELRVGIFIGFLAALSSTAIVLKAYADRRELGTPQGALVTGILLFQDFCLAPMIVLAPVLADTSATSWSSILARLSLGVLAMVVAFMVARRVMPRLLFWIVRTRVREILVLGALGACLGMGMLTERLGFSMALGAFLAGLVLSESEYSHQVNAEVLPFRDLFNSLFFISLGMLLQLDTIRTDLGGILLFGAGIVVVKVLVGSAAVGFMKYPARIAFICGLSLAQVGEFSFVLANVGLQVGLIDPTLYQRFLGASIFTMFLTPLWINLAPRIAIHLPNLHMPGPLARLGRDIRGSTMPARPEHKDHVLLVGYGLNGRNVARVLRETAVPFVVLELNADLVRQAHADGVPVEYGDATRGEILEVCGVRRANMLVLAISDLEATRQAVRVARRENPGLYILARTRSVSEIDSLLRFGADDVIPEEFETSIEIFCRVLARYHVPRNIIDAQVRILRDEGYEVLRGAPLSGHAVLERVTQILQGTLTETFLVKPGSAADGRTLGELDLRRRTGASVIAVVSDGVPQTNPEPQVPLAAHDTLVLVGHHAALEAAFDLLEGRTSQVALRTPPANPVPGAISEPTPEATRGPDAPESL